MTRTRGTDRIFVDEARILVRGGKGGDGCSSFRREKFVPRGGPDGGDGGHGGSVYLLAQAGLDTLLELAGKHHWRAENGRPGSGKGRSGRRGQDLEVPVPVGTLVYDADTSQLLKDMTRVDERIRVGRGGRGGRGNARFASPTRQAPRECEPGRPGQERNLRLELKLIADVGLIGLPNAGKSTLLSRLTNAHPKVAAYPFTTKEPQLGIAELPGFRRLVLADIPGLIEGAHEGVGLGDAFLRHIERTRVLAHLVDVCPLDGGPAPARAYEIVRRELGQYSAELSQRSELIVATKMDLTDSKASLERFRAAVGANVAPISSAAGGGLRELLEALWTAVEDARRREAAAAPETIDFGEDDPDADEWASLRG